MRTRIKERAHGETGKQKDRYSEDCRRGVIASEKTDGRINQRVYSHRRKLFASLGMVTAAFILIVFSVWPVHAAIELLYFRAIASPSTVLLEWATVSETNIRGFVIECKKADEPDDAYHAIGGRDAVGRPDVGAAYSFNVASGLEPGVAYCFRLVERTIDGLPGEQFEICGYGLSITPTPMGQGQIGGFGDATPAGVIIIPRLDVEETPVALPTVTPFAPSTAAPSVPAFEPTVDPLSEIPTPTPLTVVTPSASTPVPPIITPVTTPVQPVSPQAGPFQPDSPLNNGDAREAAAELTENMPAFTPSPAVTVAVATVEATTVETVPVEPDSPLAQPTATFTPVAGAQIGNEAFLPGVVIEDDSAPDATPTPLYLVVTATPTAEAVAVVPTFTPWPTVTPEPASDLWSQLIGATPNSMTQNLVVMLLCLIFLTASGLGTLGLVTSVIYMRSRAQREEHLARLYGRRRF